MCPNLKTTGSAFEELLVPQHSKQCFTILEPRVPSSRNWTNALKSWNPGFPAPGTHGSRMLEPMPIGTTGSQFEELLAPKPWNQCFPILEPRVSSLENCSFPNLGTNASILEPQVPSSPNERFPNLGTNDPQSRNPGFPARGTHGSHMLEPMPPNLGTTGSQLEELLLPKPWNQCFPVLEPWVSSLKNCLFPNLGTNASILVVLQTNGSQTLEPMIPNLGASGSQFWELAVPKRWNRRFPILEPMLPSSRN